MKNLALVAVLAVSLAACSAPFDGSSPTHSVPSAASANFFLTSPDFAAGAELPDWAAASAYGGQCTGDNLNPALAWTGAPEGTQAYAIVLVDTSANNFVHWVHVDIPAAATSVSRGESSTLAGTDGANAGTAPGYFGPCPPGPDHVYEFSVYALDATLHITGNAPFAEVEKAIFDHELAEATIIGVKSGPA